MSDLSLDLDLLERGDDLINRASVRKNFHTVLSKITDLVRIPSHAVTANTYLTQAGRGAKGCTESRN